MSLEGKWIDFTRRLPPDDCWRSKYDNKYPLHEESQPRPLALQEEPIVLPTHKEDEGLKDLSGWIAEQRKNYAIFRRYDRFHNGQMYLISIVDHPPFNSDPI